MMTSYKAHHMFHDFVPKPINRIAYNDVSHKMAVARFDEEECQIEIWSIEDGYWVFEKTLPSVASIEDMLWHTGLLISGGLDGNLTVHDVQKARVKETVSSNYGPIWCLALNPEQSLIAAGTEEGCVVLFEVLSDAVVYKQSIAKQPGRILSISWYLKETIVTGGSDVRVFDITSGRCVQRIGVGKQVCVWSLVVTRSFTIITGDSSGHTSFWYGQPGQVSHSKRFRSHEADIHSLALNPAQNVVAVAGVDGIVLFKSVLSKNNENDKTCTWVMAGKKTYHSHDVRTVKFLNGRVLVSAGLDCQIVVSEKKKSTLKISPYHQKCVVRVARLVGCLLQQFEKRLELWMADQALLKEEDPSKFKQDTPADHIKLSEIHSHTLISCSHISDDSKFIILSNQKGTYFYRSIIHHKGDAPSIRVCGMMVPKSFQTTPSTHVSISHPSTHNYPTFATVSNGNIITFLSLDDEDGGGRVGGGKIINLSMKILSTVYLQEDISVKDITFNNSSSFLYVASLKNSIIVIDVAMAAVACTLPQHHKPPSSFSAHPSHPHRLLVSYADGLISEYHSKKGMHTNRSKTWNRRFHSDFIKHQRKFINRISYDSSRPDRLVLQHDSGFSLVDWSYLKKKETSTKASELFRYIPTKCLFSVEVTPRKRNIFVVQKDAVDMMHHYQPPLKKHMFGQ